MNCNQCGLPLPSGMIVCSRCGAYNLPNSNDPTVVASQKSSPAPTYFGSDPYNTNPYQTPAVSSTYPPPMPVPSPRKGVGRTLGIVLGIISVVVVLLCVGSAFLISTIANYHPQAQANSTSTPVPTPTLAPDRNPYPPNTGTLVVNDPLQNNSQGYKWIEGTTSLANGDPTNTATCAFVSGAYHISRTQPGTYVCGPAPTDLLFNNLAFEVKLTTIKGAGGGLVFRIDPQAVKGYVLFVGVLGNYVLRTLDYTTQVTDNQYHTLRSGTNAAIKEGLNQTNLVAIVANGSMISIYINGQLIDSVQDSTYAGGRLGLVTDGENSGSEIMATNLRIWRI